MRAYFINDLHIDKWVKTESKSGFTNKSQYKKLLEKWCLPADILFLGGDVASSVNAIYTTFLVLRDMYSHIFYIYGNHEMRLTEEDRAKRLNSYTKRERIEQFLDTAMNNADKLSILKGSSASWRGVVAAGGMGYADGKMSSDHSTLDSRWSETNDSTMFDLGWTTDMHQIAEYENDAIARGISDVNNGLPRVVMSHFAPYQILGDVASKTGFDPGLSAFDASDHMRMLRDGTIWHFGHVHDRVMREIEVDGKRIVAVNNSIGTREKPPMHDIPREEFLMDV